MRQMTVLAAVLSSATLALLMGLRETPVEGEARRLSHRDYQLAWAGDAEISDRLDEVFARVAADLQPDEGQGETVTGLTVKPESDAPDAGLVVEVDALKWYGCGCCEYAPTQSTFNNQDFALVARLPNVRQLRLNLTQMTDAGTRPMARMQQLVSLDISDNEFTDEALRAVGSLHRLESLNLSGNRLNGSGLRFLSRLKSLKSLDLTETPITDDHLRHLSQLTSLEVLNLDETQLRGDGLRHLEGLNHLRSLTLNNCPLSSDGLRHLSPLPALVEFRAASTAVDSGLSVFEGMPELRLLNLSQTNINDASMQGLTNVVGLETLGLDGSQVSDEGLRHLSRMSSLKYLYVHGTKVSPAGIRHLKNSRQLIYYTVQQGKTPDTDLNQHILEEVSTLKNLSSLRVRLTPDSSGVCDLHLKDMPNLSSLIVICPDEVDEIALLNLPTLTSLQIVGEPKAPQTAGPRQYEDAPSVRRIVIRNIGERLYRFDMPIPAEFECDGPELIYSTRLNGRITRQFAAALEKTALINEAFLRVASDSDPEAVADLLLHSAGPDGDQAGSLGLSIELDELNADWSRILTRAMTETPGEYQPLRIRAKRLTGESPISLSGITRLTHLQLEGFSRVEHLRITAEDMPPNLRFLTIRDAEIGTLEFDSCHVPIMAERMRSFDRLLINGYERPYHHLPLFHDEFSPTRTQSMGLRHTPEVVELRDLPHVEYCELRYGNGMRELKVTGACPKLKVVSYAPADVRIPEPVLRGYP